MYFKVDRAQSSAGFLIGPVAAGECARSLSERLTLVCPFLWLLMKLIGSHLLSTVTLLLTTVFHICASIVLAPPGLNHFQHCSPLGSDGDVVFLSLDLTISLFGVGQGLLHDFTLLTPTSYPLVCSW